MSKRQPSQNARLGILLATLALTMLAVAFAFVPLYRLFCQTFGIPVPSVLVGQAGTPKPVGTISERTVTVRFTANSNVDMPVRLKPREFVRKVNIGESVLTAYEATNTSNRAIDGVAVHMLHAQGGRGEQDVGAYVDLQQCFCFELQHYPAGRDVTLPLSFHITPDLPPGVHTITFSYTLFEAMENDPRIKEHKDEKG